MQRRDTATVTVLCTKGHDVKNHNGAYIQIMDSCMQENLSINAVTGILLPLSR